MQQWSGSKLGMNKTEEQQNLYTDIQQKYLHTQKFDGGVIQHSTERIKIKFTLR